MIVNPLVVFQAVGSIHHQHELVFRDAINQQVIHNASLAIGHAAVLDLSRGEFAGVIAGDVLNQVQRLRTFDAKLAHVRDVEHSAGLSHRVVFNDEASIGNGHFESSVRNHFGSSCLVFLVQGGRCQWGR